MPQQQTYLDRIKQFIHFITIDIWRMTETEVTGVNHYLFNLLKTFVLTSRRFYEDNLQSKASALTYSTLLAIVPVLALLFAIASGFGFKSLIETQLFDYFPGQKVVLQKGLEFAFTYLENAKGGVFVGVGMLMLFWAIISLIGTIEDVFNEIWQVKKPRSIYRKFTDYFSLFLILPVLMIVSSGISIFLTTTVLEMNLKQIIHPLLSISLELSPYLITWILFMFLFVFLPNIKVKIRYAIIPAIITTLAFQFFQYVYIHGQIWVSTYNAIYGSFAALPLLLLWLQLSWLIVLFGAMLTYSSQNIKNYNYERDTKSISRRYKDFVTLTVASIVVKRFEVGDKPLCADEIATISQIPIRLTKEVLYLLTEVGVLNESLDEDEDILIYQPAIDINKISVGFVLNQIDLFGSEDFKIDKQVKYSTQWSALLKSRDDMMSDAKDTLLKNLN